MKEPIAVTAIWSRCIGRNIETLVEVDGKWYRCITESGDNFSWIAEARGFKRWPVMNDDGFCAAVLASVAGEEAQQP